MNPPLIEFRNVTIQRGARVALDSVTLSIAPGEHTAILGPNGSGKSSLIKAITRECYPLRRSESSLKILGREVWNIFDLRSLLGIVTNDLMLSCTRNYSGREIVLSGFFSSVGVWPNHHVTPAMEEKTDQLLDWLEIGHLAGRGVDEMSSGEARRILIARALVHDPQALVLDEPTTSLDIHAIHELTALLRKLAAAGASIILVTHHLADIIPEIDRVVLLGSGKILCDGAKRDVLTAPALSNLFRTNIEIVQRNGFYHAW